MLNAVHTLLKHPAWWALWLVLRTCSPAAQCQSNDDTSATHVNITFPEVCPLGEALRSGEGRLIKCNCPPHPFCPLLYYCKMVEHGQAGICCPDFRVQRRHHIKPEESRLTSSRLNAQNSGDTSAKCENCPANKADVLISGENDNNLPRVSKDQGVGAAPGSPNMHGTKAKVATSNLKANITTKCKKISEEDYPKLPEPECTYLEVDPDSDGCPLLPKVVCPPEKIVCPEIPIVIVPPECTLGEGKFDDNGCALPKEVICKTSSPLPEPSVFPSAPSSRPRKPVERRIIKRVKKKLIIPTTTTGAPSPPPCPFYPLPPTLSPDCQVAAPKKDARGCYLPPEVVCEIKPTNYFEIIEEKLPEVAGEKVISDPDSMEKSRSQNCPKIRMPFVQPGCKLMEAKYDENGCMLMPEITCDPSIISRISSSCPPVNLPVMNPLCTFGPDRNDSNGCPMIPEIICPVPFDDLELITKVPAETVTVPDKFGPKIMSHCPYIPPPYLPEGCSYGPAKYDERGCFMEPEVICPEKTDMPDIVDKNEIVERSTTEYPNEFMKKKPNETTTTTVAFFEPEMPTIATSAETFGFTIPPEPPMPYKPPRKQFKDMMTAEFYHIVQTNVPPDAGVFRRTTAIPVVTSGRFLACQAHADCFHLREPREWCDTGSLDSQAVWTDKSCHCSEDTLVPACIVERSRRGFMEWTFCAEYSQCVESEWKKSR